MPERCTEKVKRDVQPSEVHLRKGDDSYQVGKGKVDIDHLGVSTKSRVYIEVGS